MYDHLTSRLVYFRAAELLNYYTRHDFQKARTSKDKNDK